jgi:Zn-dependent peptidase ImmA (M78 family)/DNA-binding XRE family transcriptional regulator
MAERARLVSTLDRQDPRALGERLRAARAKAGLTQEAAADALQVARTTLIALEKGQRRIREDELRAMSRAYGASVNALLRPSAIHVDLVPRFRSRSGTTAEESIDAAKLLSDLAAAEAELERALDQPFRPSYPPERPILPGDVREQAEDGAIELRHRLGLGMAPIADIVTLLELEIGMRVFVRPLPDSVSGLFVFDNELGACILLNQNHSRERRAMTGAHECGHFISARHEPDIVELNRGPQSREERFATAFGLAFLMPAPTIRRRFQEVLKDAGRFSPRHLILLAHMFYVSPEGMCRRLESLKLLPEGTWESLRDRKFSSETVRQVLGDRPRSEETIVPPRLWMLAAEAYRHDLFSEGQLSQMLHMDRVDIRKMLDTLGSEDQHGVESITVD